MNRDVERALSSEVFEPPGHHYLLLSEYTEKLKRSCARHERVRLYVALLVALLMVPIVVGLVFYFGVGGEIEKTITSMISENVFLFASIVAFAVSYASVFTIAVLQKMKQTKRALSESAKLLSRLLSRASQKYDQDLSVNEEAKLEMEIRLVEAENALSYAEKLASPSSELIASVGTTILAMLATIIALFTFP